MNFTEPIKALSTFQSPWVSRTPRETPRHSLSWEVPPRHLESAGPEQWNRWETGGRNSRRPSEVLLRTRRRSAPHWQWKKLLLWDFGLNWELMGPLFLASTVSALHRNEHIWNASHPLLVTYYCRVTVYSPGMEAKKLTIEICVSFPGFEPPNTSDQETRIYRLSYSNMLTQWVVPYRHVNAD